MRKNTNLYYLISIAIIFILFILSSINIACAAEAKDFEFSGDNVKGVIDGEAVNLQCTIVPNANNSSEFVVFNCNTETNKYKVQLSVDRNDKNLYNEGQLKIWDKNNLLTPPVLNSKINVKGTAPVPQGNVKAQASGGNKCLKTIFGCFDQDESALKKFVSKAFVWVAGVISTLSMLGLIYAGYVYITSAGNPDSIARAKDIIWTSIASLLIIVFSWAMFNLLGLT